MLIAELSWLLEEIPRSWAVVLRNSGERPAAAAWPVVKPVLPMAVPVALRPVVRPEASPAAEAKRRKALSNTPEAASWLRLAWPRDCMAEAVAPEPLLGRHITSKVLALPSTSCTRVVPFRSRALVMPSGLRVRLELVVKSLAAVIS